jgi:hypothetical protein
MQKKNMTNNISITLISYSQDNLVVKVLLPNRYVCVKIYTKVHMSSMIPDMNIAKDYINSIKDEIAMTCIFANQNHHGDDILNITMRKEESP